MTTENNESKNMSVSVPLGALGAVLAIAVGAAVYIVLNRGEDESVPPTPGAKAKAKAKGMRRRIGLSTAITIIENDTTRKVLLAALRAIAKRS